MLLYIVVYMFLVFCISSLFCVTYGQTMMEMPRIACPNYFRYAISSGTYLGMITLPNSIYDGTTKFEVLFSMAYASELTYSGRLSFYPDWVTTWNSLQARGPVSYRVDFPQPNGVPKLIKIAVNGRDICSASAYSSPSIVIKFEQPPFMPQAPSEPYNINTVTSYIHQFNPYFSNIVTLPAEQQTVPEAPLPPLPPFPPSDYCGRENTGMSATNFNDTVMSPTIYGGSALRQGQYPWMTAIYEKKHMGKSFFCGGSLVSASVIISAAHCVYRNDPSIHRIAPEKLLVELGRYDLSSETELVVSSDIRNFVVHQNYVYHATHIMSDADLALLWMKNPIDRFTESISPICLWTESTDASLIIGKSATVAGWGFEEVHNEISPIPKKVETFIQPSSRNDRTLGAAKFDGEGTCSGDSGGALMMSRHNHWVLRGVISGASRLHNRRCEYKYSISVYCDVAKHMTWVQSYL